MKNPLTFLDPIWSIGGNIIANKNIIENRTLVLVNENRIKLKSHSGHYDKSISYKFSFIETNQNPLPVFNFGQIITARGLTEATFKYRLFSNTLAFCFCAPLALIMISEYFQNLRYVDRYISLAFLFVYLFGRFHTARVAARSFVDHYQ